MAPVPLAILTLVQWWGHFFQDDFHREGVWRAKWGSQPRSRMRASVGGKSLRGHRGLGVEPTLPDMTVAEEAKDSSISGGG